VFIAECHQKTSAISDVVCRLSKDERWKFKMCRTLENGLVLINWAIWIITIGLEQLVLFHPENRQNTPLL